MTRKKVPTQTSIADAIREAVLYELTGRNFAQTLWWEPEAAIAEAVAYAKVERRRGYLAGWRDGFADARKSARKGTSK